MEKIQLHKNESGIYSLIFQANNSDAPTLSEETLEEIQETLEEIWNSAPDALVVYSNHEDIFCAGADVNELAQIDAQSDAFDFARNGQNILDMFSEIDCPTVAGVHGTCLGGGTELALACDAIFASDHHSTKFGFPEVNLGIIPGFGGTQRLPRKISLEEALKMINTGKNVRAHKAQSIGLVDKLIQPEGFRQRVKDQISLHLDNGSSLRGSSKMGFMSAARDTIAKNSKAGLNFACNRAEKMVKAKAGEHYPAPFKAIESIREGLPESLDKGLKKEAELVSELATSPKTRHLMELVLESQDRTEDAKESSPDRPDEWNCGVIGAGVMGGSIAQLISFNGSKCRLKDIAPEPLKAGLNRAYELFNYGAQKGKWEESFVEEGMNRISPTTEWSGFGRRNLIIEAVPEKMDLKQDVLQKMESQSSPETVLATNTSSFPLSDLSSKMDNPERLVGIHFFNPVHKMRLVEVVRGEETDQKWIDRARGFVADMGKVPIVVKETPGFLVNRLLFFYLQEAMILLNEGISMEKIDETMEEFGMDMPPFEVLDQVGLDIAGHVSECLIDAFEDRVQELSLLEDMLEEDWLGKKTDIGFYRYSDGDKEGENRGVYRKIEQAQSTISSAGKEEIRDRLLLALINEASRTLEENVVESPTDLDISMILGTGFAPFRGGPWTYAEEWGWNEIHKKLNKWKSEGKRFEPTDLIQQKAQQNEASSSQVESQPEDQDQSPEEDSNEDQQTKQQEETSEATSPDTPSSEEAGEDPSKDEEEQVKVEAGTKKKSNGH